MEWTEHNSHQIDQSIKILRLNSNSWTQNSRVTWESERIELMKFLLFRSWLQLCDGTFFWEDIWVFCSVGDLHAG